ncbi:NADP-dependent oxidoreductase domain protein [Kalmanozyma brasiliensis GHG001]|uniref:NADP-dependent oxidoreductase domain-containing protein n=1 Tax=Kalmanozyma brasiliensis (strain GHG001) TaxID=1365824 RepID=V5GH03_KALBG|nr:NADP-dependent oxidoreductase domain protein [Kalmanozyma brasiliensis GHG001]EST05292.1 NADP-dependent oxidoreductase domain protein [Kalmanozyma brasiliensis GHG001]
MPIPTREFAKTGEQVGAIGYGAMGLAAFYGDSAPDSVVNAIFDKCLADGVTHWDTADMYSPMGSGKLGYNEEQIGRYFASHPGAREKVTIATKFVNRYDADGSFSMDGSPEWCHQACNDSLKRLGVDQIDLFYAHRPDPKVDVTKTVGAMKELKEQGKIRYIGVSEYNLDQLERANKVVHIDAIQIEISPWTPEALTNGILAWAEKNGTALVAYSPLGRGFLTGQYKTVDDLPENDFRRHNPRFTGDNFAKNLELVNDIKKIADKKNATPGQIALAWLLQKSPIILPIPGTKKEKYLEENNKAAEIKLSKEEMDEIDGVINSFKVSGTRYAPEMMQVCAF